MVIGCNMVVLLMLRGFDDYVINFVVMGLNGDNIQEMVLIMIEQKIRGE